MITLRPYFHLFTPCTHQLSICYIVGLRYTENKSKGNYKTKIIITSKTHSLWPQEVYSPRVEATKSLWVSTRKDTGTGEGPNSQRSKGRGGMFPYRMVPKLSLVGEAGGGESDGHWGLDGQSC